MDDPRELAEARAFIEGQNWRWAKTYATTLPHWYCVWPFHLDKGTPEYEKAANEFRAFQAWIRVNAATLTAKGYRAAVLDGWQYWAIHPVINRAEWCEEHDQLATECDHA